MNWVLIVLLNCVGTECSVRDVSAPMEKDVCWEIVEKMTAERTANTTNSAYCRPVIGASEHNDLVTDITGRRGLYQETESSFAAE